VTSPNQTRRRCARAASAAPAFTVRSSPRSRSGPAGRAWSPPNVSRICARLPCGLSISCRRCRRFRRPLACALMRPAMLRRMYSISFSTNSRWLLNCAGLRQQRQVALLAVVREVALPAVGDAVGDLDDRVGDRVEEAPVVADDDAGAGIAHHEVLDELDALQVEVVGRLVEDQQVGRRRHQDRQLHARLLAAAQHRRRPSAGRRAGSRGRQHLLDLVLAVVAAAGLERGLQRAVGAQRRLVAGGHLRLERTHALLERVVFAGAAHHEVHHGGALRHRRHLRAVGDAQVAARVALAEVGVVDAGEDAHHRRLAGAVVADDADAIAFVDAQRQPSRIASSPKRRTILSRLTRVIPHRNGRWSAPLPVPENWATSQETPTIHPPRRPRRCPKTGKARLVLFSGLRPIRSSMSEDEGRPGRRSRRSASSAASSRWRA
jgi:hypothetical protein